MIREPSDSRRGAEGCGEGHAHTGPDTRSYLALSTPDCTYNDV